MEKIKIGKIVNVVGLKGELKLYNYSDRQDRYEDLESIYIGDESFNIEKIRYQKDMIIIKVFGIDDRNAAEALKNKFVFISEADLDELAEGQHYIKDLIGLEVVSQSGEKIGILKNIQTETAQELYCIMTEAEKMIYIPGVKEFILDIDEKVGKITVKLPEGLLEL